nr:relaxase/mobilization nuclease domain-containing protein [Algoriphagus sp. AGSA1]
MSLKEQLTKSKQGLYHAQINPAYEEDRQMTDEDWHKAADILEHALGFEGQRRAIVLHEKKGRLHAHVVWERYDAETGKMKTISHNYKAHDQARQEIEKYLNQEPTPTRNKSRDDIKEVMTGLWDKTETGADFLKEVKNAGFCVAAGSGKRPFMVVDDKGRSFDLVRQLKGVRTKQVRERLDGEKLMDEKDAIELMRQLGNQKRLAENEPEQQAETAHRWKANPETAKEFARNRDDIFAGEKKKDTSRSFSANASDNHASIKQRAESFVVNETMADKEKSANPFAEKTHAFAENRNTLTASQIKRQQLINEMKSQLKTSYHRQRDKRRDF